LALAIGLETTVAAVTVAVLLIVFAGSVATNLLRGRAFDCGCGTSVVSRQISWGLVTQELVLAVAAVFVAFVGPRVIAVDQVVSGTADYPVGNAIAAPIIACLLLIATGLARESRAVWRLVR
jgi:hypothetical protein